MTIKKLLVPIDLDGPTARHALRHAAAIAARRDAEITLFHAVDLAPISRYSDAILGGTAKAFHRAAVEQAGGELQRLALRPPLRGLKVECAVRSGDGAAQGILDFAEALEADLIVLGVRGASYLDRRLLGDVSGRIMRVTRRPVLFVPGREAEPPAQLPDYHSVFLATDLSASTAMVGKLVTEFVRPFESQVGVVHVTDRHNVDEEEQEEALRRRVQDETRVVLNGIRFDVHVLTGKPSHRIAAFAGESDCDLLFIGSSGHHALTDWFLGTTASRVIRLLPCPVCLVPTGGRP